MPATLMPNRAMNLGGSPRTNSRYSDNRGVNALGTQMVPAYARTPATSQPAIRQIPAISAIHWYKRISDRVGTGQTGAPQVPQMTVPRYRLGTVPKLATGTGQTASKAGSALGYVPGGYASTQFVAAGAGMGQMPSRQESFDGTFGLGFPRKGVSAESGRTSMSPTWQPHDWVIADRFSRHGRQPGSWQETAYGPEYRNLRATQIPEVYNMGASLALHLARPLSPNAFFLPYQTPPTIAAQIGAAGMNVSPLGY